MSITIDTLQTVIEFSLSLQVSVVITLSLKVLVSLLLVEPFNGKSHGVGLDINCLPKRRCEQAHSP
ncbi:Uncharacterised protein [Vibrio vulnificus]|nr:putative membrane protein [Vibrio vulnificus]SUP38573.1 Uncharacterised protein [Vibrio vulnificus]